MLQESKKFFFEKKNQKTFGRLGFGHLRRHNPKPSLKKFFGFFFFKKRSAFLWAF
jgi:hypothetical protein